MALLSKKGIALLLAAFAGSFALTYIANHGVLQSSIPNDGTRNNLNPHLSALAPMLSGESARASASNFLALAPLNQRHPTVGPGTQMLMLSQGGYVSKRLLGCWRGTTAEQPTEWRVLSFLGKIEAYHRDNINLCLNLKNGKLEVTDTRWSCTGCNYSKNHHSSYRVVSASGDKMTLQVEDSARPLTNKGQQDFVLNQDDTIDERIAFTGYFLGHRSIQGVTTAHLKRDHG
ncbi:MAG: hypothetical protein WCE23_08530 [Candidatus Binatus sp.]|uniref:hypothetical protein n=1 Tax=Candidatus Binatus sp. TaxID=2811406 RepID=UPI003C74C7C7